MVIAITERAARKIQEILAEQQEQDLCLRLYVAKGGCEGFTYGMAFDRERREDDQVIEANGIRVLV
ncbi:MAG: iron-sulfur cluster assembly accessory protein, partial [Armatimonadota bacterium]|nr:iron-sulfur cluster assembly accessory protein [Armatimonadota bacterium]